VKIRFRISFRDMGWVILFSLIMVGVVFAYTRTSDIRITTPEFNTSDANITNLGSDNITTKNITAELIMLNNTDITLMFKMGNETWNDSYVLIANAILANETWNDSYVLISNAILANETWNDSYVLIANAILANNTYNETYHSQLGANTTVEIMIAVNASEWWLNETGDIATGNFTFDGNTFHIDSTNNRIGIGTTTPEAELYVIGEVNVNHTAIGNFERAMDLIVNASGYADVKALEIDYIVNTLTAGEFEAIIDVLVNDRLSTGGNIEVIRIDKVGTGTAGIYGIVIGAGIDVIKHDSGTFGNMSEAFLYDDSVNEYTNATGNFTVTEDDITMFSEDDDVVYVGHTAKFSEIEFILNTTSLQSINPEFEYSAGSDSWTAFVPIDETNGMTQSGNVVWESEDLSGWDTDAVNGSDTLYWVRINRTRNNLVTLPIEDLVQTSTATVYKWGKDGDLTVKNISLTGDITGADDINATEFYEGGVRLDVKYPLANKTFNQTYHDYVIANISSVSEYVANETFSSPFAYYLDNSSFISPFSYYVDNSTYLAPFCSYIDNSSLISDLNVSYNESYEWFENSSIFEKSAYNESYEWFENSTIFEAYNASYEYWANSTFEAPYALYIKNDTFIAGINLTCHGIVCVISDDTINFDTIGYLEKIGLTNLTTCADDQIIKMSGGGWICAADDSGTGGTGDNFFVDGGAYVYLNISYADSIDLGINRTDAFTYINASQFMLNGTDIASMFKMGNETWNETYHSTALNLSEYFTHNRSQFVDNSTFRSPFALYLDNATYLAPFCSYIDNSTLMSELNVTEINCDPNEYKTGEGNCVDNSTLMDSTGTTMTGNFTIAGNFSDGAILVGVEEGASFIYFYEAGYYSEYIAWDDDNDMFNVSDGFHTPSTLWVDGSSLLYGNVAVGEDVYTTGSGDDFWLGTSTQSVSLFQANADGSMNASSGGFLVDTKGNLNLTGNITSVDGNITTAEAYFTFLNATAPFALYLDNSTFRSPYSYYVDNSTYLAPFCSYIDNSTLITALNGTDINCDPNEYKTGEGNCVQNATINTGNYTFGGNVTLPVDYAIYLGGALFAYNNGTNNIITGG